MTGSVIVAGARTPMGRLLGSLKDFSGADLGGVAIKAALERSGRAPGPGRLRDHGPGAAGRRRADPGAPGRGQGGHPDVACPALTINKVCLSGLDAIALADQLIRAGEFDIVVAGGLESMTQAPHLLPKSRAGLQVRRRRRCVDSMAYDGLYDVFDHIADGRARPSDVNTTARARPREEQDAFAARSHQRAAAAQKNGVFDDEIAPVTIPQRKGDPIVFTRRRGHPRRHDRRVPGPAAPGVRQGRHDHRRLAPRRSPTARPRSS